MEMNHSSQGSHPFFFFLAFIIGCIGLSDDGLGNGLADLTRPIPGRPARASSGLFDPESNRDAHHVRAGQRFLLADLNGPGEVRHIWFTLASRDRRYPRTLVLRVYYDGSTSPSIETPIGDFFAAGNGMRANISSLPIEVSSYGRALNSYWRMPFKRRCRIEAHNEGTESITVYFQCDWLKLDALPEDVYYFHARYRQEYPAKPFTWYTIFEGEGEGHYVGTVLSSQNTVRSWFGEADDRFYVDGEEVPSLIGTGTEDYFNDAWNLRLTSNLRVGTTICEPKGDERRITAYRWHIEDPVPFKKSLKVEIERRSFIHVTDPATGEGTTHDFKYRPDYWSSVAYWYQKGIAEPAWPFPPVEERVLPEVWIEPSEMVDRVMTSPGLEPRRASNRTCNLKRYFLMHGYGPGAWVAFPLTLPEEGRYAVSVFQNLFKHHGIWRVSLVGDGGTIVLHPGLDFWDWSLSRVENWPENYEHGTTVETKVGTHTLAAGDYWVKFECTGANPLTRHPVTGEYGQGFSIGLDAICFRRLPIDDPFQWMEDYLEREAALFTEWRRTASGTVEALSRAVMAFYRSEGRHPRSLDELAGTPHWEGGRIPLDPWHQPYEYRAPGEVRPWSFDVWSNHGNSRNPEVWIGNWKHPFRLKNEAGADCLVFEGEDLEVARAGDGVTWLDQKISSYGLAPISGKEHLFIRFNGPGDWMEIELPGEIPSGRYEVFLFLATSWDYGVCKWSLAGHPIGAPFDGHTPTIGMKVMKGNSAVPGNGALNLRVEAAGKAALSTGYFAGLDAVVLVPEEGR